MDTVKNNFDSEALVNRVIDSVEGSLQGIIARPSRMRWFLAGAILGGLGAMFLDPVHGERRRTQLKEKVSTMSREGLEFGRIKLQEFQGTNPEYSTSENLESQIPVQH